MHVLWLVNQLWFIVPVKAGKPTEKSRVFWIIILSNIPQVFYGF